MIILTKPCKGIQYLGNLYTTIMKPLLLISIPLQVPVIKISNFSNNYILAHIITYRKSSTRINHEKFQKMFKASVEWLLIKPVQQRFFM